MLESERMELPFGVSEEKSQGKLSRAAPSSPGGSDGVEALDPTIPYNIALFNVEQGHLALATTQLQEMLVGNEDFAPAHCLLGEIFYKQKNFPKAILSLQNSLELDNNNVPAHRMLGEIHELMAAASRVSGRQKEVEEHVRISVEAFQSALDKHPDNTKILHQLQDLRYNNGLLDIDEILVATRDIWKTLIATGVHSNLPLIERIIKDKVGKQLFSDYGNNVNGRNKEGWTPLEVCSGSIVLTELLVQTYKADVRTPGRNGRTIPSAAASLGKIEVVRYLALRGASLGASDRNKENILHTCIRDHVSEHNNPRNLVYTIRGIFALLRQQDQAHRSQIPGSPDQTAFQIILLKNAGKGASTGTTLLLQLLTQRNRYNQTVIELADSLKKYDLVGLFREELALLINERLGGLVNNLFVPIKGSNQVSPIICHNPLEIIALSPLYTTFLKTYLGALPGSVFGLDSPAYKRFVSLESAGAALISLSAKAAKAARINERHIEAAHAAHAITEIVLGHGCVGVGVLNSLEVAQLRSTIRTALPKGLCITTLSVLSQSGASKSVQQDVALKYNVLSTILDYAAPEPVTTSSFVSIIPQPHIVRLNKECILPMYQMLYSCKVRTFFQNDGRLEDSEIDIAKTQRNIMQSIEEDFGLKPFTGNSQYIKGKVAAFSRQLDKEITSYIKKIKADLLASKVKEDAVDSQILSTLNQMCMDDRLMNIHVPSFRLLTEIFEDLTGLQVRIKSSNFGWVARLDETRKATLDSPSVSIPS